MTYCRILFSLLLAVFFIGGCGSQQHKKLGSGSLLIPVYEVTAPTSGQILGLIAEKDERIGKGQPLFAIGDSQLDAKVKELTAQTAKAAAELKRLEQSAVNAPPPADLTQAQARLAAAQQKAAKMNNLLAQGAVSRQQAQAAQAELQQASASLQAASQASMNTRPASPEAIAAQKKLLEQLQQQQAQALSMQQANEAVSPCTGVITSVAAGNNAAVRKGQTVLEITANESCQVSFTVSNAATKELTVGQKVTLKASDHSFSGSISQINAGKVTVISEAKPASLSSDTEVAIYTAN